MWAFTASLGSLHRSLIVCIVRKRFLIFSCFFLLFMHSRIASSCPVAPSIVLGAPGSSQTLIFCHQNTDDIHWLLMSFAFVLLKLNLSPLPCSVRDAVPATARGSQPALARIVCCSLLASLTSLQWLFLAL